ncbi:MAG: pyridoxamine 5'-phosphate oxidase family protein [Anaerolineae bacterium]|nr:pyridoxamine 5'-phosphate oxidase family protein [Anaerolineae bacterium]
MAALPTVVLEAWESREGPIVLTTVDGEGTPNAIYATCVRLSGDDTLVVADNFFHKTRTNILSGSKGSLLFITKEGKSYQVKGRIEYHSEGPIFDEMKQWNPARLPGHAAAALRVEQVFSGGEQLVS